eukprot:scaffold102022_cov30-Tisochrysis_lutea.AAC.5
MPTAECERRATLAGEGARTRSTFARASEELQVTCTSQWKRLQVALTCHRNWLGCSPPSGGAAAAPTKICALREGAEGGKG